MDGPVARPPPGTRRGRAAPSSSVRTLRLAGHARIIAAVRDRLTPGLVLPLYDRVARRRLWAETRALRELQWRSADELEALATSRLRRLLEQASQQVPYYRELFGQSGFDPASLRSTDDLARLPITSKAAVRDAFPERIVARDLPIGRRWPLRSGGSTGQPLEFYGDRQAHDVWLGTHFFFLEWAGTGPWHTAILITSTQYLRGNGPEPRGWRRLVRRALIGERRLHFAELEPDLDRFLQRAGPALRSGAYYLRGYASKVADLAAQLLERGYRLPSPPRAVVTHGEELTEHHRVLIERGLGHRPVSQYSLWEVPQIAQTCPDEPGLLHVNNQRAVVRVVRPDGADAAPGESGRLLLTDLHNQVMPFVNYDTGDQAALGPPCPCGRGFPTLTRLEGRTGQAIQLPDGRRVDPQALVHFLTWGCPVLPWVWQYQAVQTAPGEVVLRVVPTGHYDDLFAERLRDELTRLFGPDLAVRIEAVPEIAPEPNGKRPVVKVLAAR